MRPPLLPSEAYRRVVRLARIDGMSILLISGAFALVSASSRDVPGAVVGLLVAGAGAAEFHGSGLLRLGQRTGMGWLILSQLGLMAVILVYAGLRLREPDIGPLRAVMTDELAAQIKQAGMTVDDFLAEFLRLFYVAVAAATVLYQGGMAFYYLRKRPAVLRALEEDESA